MDPEVRALINEVRSLVSSIGKMTGASSGGSLFGGPGSKGSLVDPYGVVPTTESKKLVEALTGNTAATYHLEKTTKKQTDATLDHIKKMEQLGAVVKAAGDLMGIAVKYNITRPYELMGGQGGITARGALEREKDFGKAITSAIGGIVAMIPGGAPIGLGIMGLGAAGGNQLIGRVFGQDQAITGSTRQSIAQMTQSGLLSYQEQQMLRFGGERVDFGGRGMGGQGFDTFRTAMAKLGIGGPEATQLYGQSLSIGGARGMSRMDSDVAQMAVRQGIYGDAQQVLVGSLLGGRAGFGQGDIMAASRRSGFTMDATGQAALATRMQTFLAGPAAGNRLFEMASRTDLSRTGGIQAAAGAITQAAGGMAGAAEGNEGSEMLLFQQFRNANPGSSYMDFVEARRNGVNDPRWLKTIRGAANNFAGQGQMGRIMGQALGVATTPMGVSGVAKMMNEAFTGKLGDASRAGGMANLAPDVVSTTLQTYTTNIAQAIALQNKHGGELIAANEALTKLSETQKDWNELVKETSRIMRKTLDNANYDPNTLRDDRNSYDITP